MGEGHQRAWGVAIGHTLLRESIQYPRREFWILSPSASCPGQPCCGLNMSPQAPTCLLLLVCSCWRHCFGKLWNFGRRGRREEQMAEEDVWRFYPAPISALSPCFLVCFLWVILCSTLSPPWNDLYLLWFPHHSGLTPSHTHTPKLWDKNKPVSFHLHCSVRHFVIATQSTWCQQWGQDADTRPGTQRRCRFVF